MRRKTRIAIADDELLFRQGLKAILKAETNFKIVFDAENGNDLLVKLRSAKTKPHVIITDLKMPELNGVELAKVLTKEFPKIKIIALTSYFSKPFILNMISIGAVAYLAKNSTPKLMIKTINEVDDKGFFYDEKVLKFIKQEEKIKRKKPIKSKFDATFFTSRELEVLELLCRQFNSNDIAAKLDISRRTVETHRNNILLKTNSKNTAGLVIYSIKNKLINLDTDF